MKPALFQCPIFAEPVQVVGTAPGGAVASIEPTLGQHVSCPLVPSYMRRWANVGLLLGQRRRRWSNSKPMLGQRPIFSGGLPCTMGGGSGVVVSTAAFHARVRGSFPVLGGLKEIKTFLPHPISVTER